MKDFLAQFKAVPSKTKYIFLLALITSIGLFVWAVVSQTMEIRERAQFFGTPPPTPVIIKECSPCGQLAACDEKLVCIAGFCRKPDGSSICFAASPTPTATPAASPTPAPTPTPSSGNGGGGDNTPAASPTPTATSTVKPKAKKSTTPSPQAWLLSSPSPTASLEPTPALTGAAQSKKIPVPLTILAIGLALLLLIFAILLLFRKRRGTNIPPDQPIPPVIRVEPPLPPSENQP